MRGLLHKGCGMNPFITFIMLVGLFILFYLIIAFIKLLSRKIHEISQNSLPTPGPYVLETNVNKSKFPYKIIDCLLTKQELQLYHTLLPLADRHNLYVNIKPRLADFIDISFQKGSMYRKYFKKIAVKHIDFLLCSKDANPVMGFEYDSTVDMPNHLIRNNFLQSIYHVIGLDVHRVHIYTPESLETLIIDSLRRSPTGGSKNWPRPV